MTAPPARAGLNALPYRCGTYATFMRTMTDALPRALPALTTRELDDASLALLDGWALIADILSFYQERNANEGYLRTATEQRSLVALAALTGYHPRPGVAAGAFLAYTLSAGGDVTLAPGNKVQSIPGPGQTAQMFETAEALAARASWNALGIRQTRPQVPVGSDPFYLSGTQTNLKPNDLLLFVRDGANGSDHCFARVSAVEPQAPASRTKITLAGSGIVWDAAASPSRRSAAFAPAGARTQPQTLLERLAALEDPLSQRRSTAPSSPQRLVRRPAEALGADADAASQLFAALHPHAAADVYRALAAAQPPAVSPVSVYAFRVHAAPYGHNAPPPPATGRRAELEAEEYTLLPDWPLAAGDRDPTLLSLDARYDRIAAGSYVAIRTFADDVPVLATVGEVRERSRRDYGLSATTTVLGVSDPFFTLPSEAPRLTLLRDVDVYAQSEALALADVPIGGDIPDDPEANPTVLELDGIYDGLLPGRWAIVSGTRTDLPGVSGSELVMIAATEHRTDAAIPGDALHTFITLSTRLAYRYARATVTVAGNVVRATQGETRTETIGSGDASLAGQRFSLKAKPLTFVSAPTQSGTRSTLTVRVDGVAWREAADRSTLSPTDRAYTTETTDAGTSVIFGDGVHGARLPSGTENVTATYRTGLGVSGNVDAGKLSLLQSRPLGVNAVVNPLPAAGGADAESREAIRRNCPTALLALDRLVALDDYADFARTFAGVARATVTQFGRGLSGTVFVSVAGSGGNAVDPHGDLAANLLAALRTLGDPRQAVAIGSCGRVILLIGAIVDLAPDALWETVEPAIRAALTARFGFAARDFAQPAYRSEAIATIAGVTGVRDVGIDLFAGIDAASLGQLAAIAAAETVRDAVVPLPARRTGGAIAAAQFVALDPAIPDSILLRTTNTGGAT